MIYLTLYEVEITKENKKEFFKSTNEIIAFLNSYATTEYELTKNSGRWSANYYLYLCSNNQLVKITLPNFVYKIHKQELYNLLVSNGIIISKKEPTEQLKEVKDYETY